MSLCGVQKADARTVTSAFHGLVRDDARTRHEFLATAGLPIGSPFRKDTYMASSDTFVIVGAGLAGAKAAETLRTEAFDGRVVLIGAEPERPYERPPLSKDYLRGETPRDKAYVHDEAFYEAHNIELLTSTAVSRIDPAASEVVLASDQKLRFDRLLLTTGAASRRLPVPGADLDGVYYLRDLRDADALRERLAAGGTAVVVGAGWIGTEVAASARQMGVDVTVVAPAAVPLERVLGPQVGTVYRDLHVDHGVTFALGTGIVALEGRNRVEAVRTSDGRVIDCDLVIAGVGAMPNTALAEQADLAVDNGILVDDLLRSSVPTIFAAGDVANACHPLYGRHVRVEHWANALNQGPAAARSMLGIGEPYDRVPYFYSDQYDLGMEHSGLGHATDQVVFRGDPAGREFIAFWLHEEAVAAAMNANVWDVTGALQALIRSGARVDPTRLTDPTVALADLAAVVAS
jgi:3-phenylpropionate/trans-cinnamate dioxygenase ferredoxin reductase component